MVARGFNKTDHSMLILVVTLVIPRRIRLIWLWTQKKTPTLISGHLLVVW